MTIQVEPNFENVDIQVLDVDVLRYLYPEWDSLRKNEKLKLARNVNMEVKRRVQVHNVTTIDLHNYLAYNINPDSSRNENGANIVFGNDNSSFSSSDTSLNNTVGQSDVSNATTDESVGHTIFTTFVDSTELNNNTLREVGLESNEGSLWNHAEITPEIDKSSSETMVVDITLSFSN